MSIFEDLIEELKEENLLEETVIEFHRKKDQNIFPQSENKPFDNPQVQNAVDFDDFKTSQNSFQPPAEDEVSAPQISPESEVYEAREIAGSAEPLIYLEHETLISTADPAPEKEKFYQEVEKTNFNGSEKEYFRKRAMDEVTGLQMVDQVLAGVERERMKIVPKSYDDLPVKLALHEFLQNAAETNSTEHAQAEFRLMQETENWCSALSHRDKHISIAHLRRHCETTRPQLSAQALIALARFYRNSPYTEQIRSKFELVLTRLFSRENEFDERELLLDREEIICQLKELYADWSSIQLYSANEEDSEILISTMKFDDFVAEAQQTESFEELINNDFFNRLRMFKQDCNENFFSPLVTASAVEANVKIGNRYLKLLNKEKENFNAATIEEKYGFLHDQAISDATGKSFELAELLNELSENKREVTEIIEVAVKQQERTRTVKVPKKPRSRLFAVNKWLLAAAVLTFVACLGLYFWAKNESKETKLSVGVKKVNLENSEFGEYIQTARLTDEVFFGITTAAWENMNGAKKEEMLRKLLAVGDNKGYKKVHLINSGGRSVGYASAEKVEIYNQ